MQGLAWDDVTWDIVWHLSLAGGIDFSYSSCHELHEALLLWSEPFFTATGSSEVTTTTSRLNVVGPASAVGDEVFLFAHGSRGNAVPAAIAVPVRQIVQASGPGRSGRFWLPPPAFGDCQFGWQLNAGAASFYSGQLAAFFDGVNAIVTSGFPSVRFAVLHRRSHGDYLANALVQPVDTWVLSRKLGTQDRRMSRVRVP